MTQRDYDYELGIGKSLEEYGMEQEAQILRDYFLLKRGYTTMRSGSRTREFYPLELYEEVIGDVFNEK